MKYIMMFDEIWIFLFLQIQQENDIHKEKGGADDIITQPNSPSLS